MEIILEKEPFEYFILDNFISHENALKLSKEFLPFDSPHWYDYDNPLEVKKTCNNWYHFPPMTYSFFKELNTDMCEVIRDFVEVDELYPDMGLHGGGWHIHGRGGKLNIHLDYAIHPKLGLKRQYNLIYYLTQDWDPNWGGNLEFWSHDEATNKPKEKIKTIDNVFNRAVIFNTAQNSWHGFSEPINCPEGIYRKSIATYYLTTASPGTPNRQRALYAPTKEQENDKEVLNLIKKRVKL